MNKANQLKALQETILDLEAELEVRQATNDPERFDVEDELGKAYIELHRLQGDNGQRIANLSKHVGNMILPTTIKETI